jgi:hypothetical protein
LEFFSPQQRKTPHSVVQEKVDQDTISCTVSRKPFDALLLFEGLLTDSFTHFMAGFSSLTVSLNMGSVQAKSTINHLTGKPVLYTSLVMFGEVSALL